MAPEHHQFLQGFPHSNLKQSQNHFNIGRISFYIKNIQYKLHATDNKKKNTYVRGESKGEIGP